MKPITVEINKCPKKGENKVSLQACMTCEFNRGLSYDTSGVEDHILCIYDEK